MFFCSDTTAATFPMGGRLGKCIGQSYTDPSGSQLDSQVESIFVLKFFLPSIVLERCRTRHFTTIIHKKDLILKE